MSLDRATKKCRVLERLKEGRPFVAETGHSAHTGSSVQWSIFRKVFCSQGLRNRQARATGLEPATTGSTGCYGDSGRKRSRRLCRQEAHPGSLPPCPRGELPYSFPLVSDYFRDFREIPVLPLLPLICDTLACDLEDLIPEAD